MIGRTSSSSVLRCQGLDLRSMDLSHLDLENVNFAHADLRHCNLSGANLTNCCMEYANLEGATLDVSGFMTDMSMNISMGSIVIGCPCAVFVVPPLSRGQRCNVSTSPRPTLTGPL